MNFIKTSDGSSTLHDSSVNETMHSVSGAYEESLVKHVFSSKILCNKKQKITILDIGFGLGYNILATIHELEKLNFKGEIFIHSLEINRSLGPYLESIIFFDGRDALYSLIKKAYYNGSTSLKNINIYLHFNDARKSIVAFNNELFDCVYHDPYSPAKNPELWTVQFFKHIYRCMKDEAILTTYSSAIHIRAAMKQVGFYISRGPSVGNKKEGTLAYKNTSQSESWISIPDSEIKAIPYIDKTFNDDKDIILERRLKTMQMIRQSMSSNSSRTDF